MYRKLRWSDAQNWAVGAERTMLHAQWILITWILSAILMLPGVVLYGAVVGVSVPLLWCGVVTVLILRRKPISSHDFQDDDVRKMISQAADAYSDLHGNKQAKICFIAVVRWSQSLQRLHQEKPSKNPNVNTVHKNIVASIESGVIRDVQWLQHERFKAVTR